MDSLKILFLEDSEFDVELIQRELRKSNIRFIPKVATGRDEFVSSLSSFMPDIILSDHSLPQFDSLSALKITKENYPHIPFILVTGSVSEDFAVTCIKSGAENYILKNNLLRLPSLIEGAMKSKHLKTENEIIKSLNLELKKMYEILAQKNKDITDSIKYAKQIQASMLPEMKTFFRVFPDAFIIFRPKDIVSGDFYWFAEHNGRFFIAAGDCTGHGVPGALLSMTGYHLLNEIVIVNNFTDPKEILEELNKRICRVFKQGKKNAINDGMDISFCVFNKSKTELRYAGARRPLYIIRDGNITEIKGSSCSIGGIQETHNRYQCNDFDLKPGDKVYLFTDGYIDQFGGKKNKKIKSRRFREIIQKLGTIDMHNQKRIINSYADEWMAGHEQTDDILVIGIEVNPGV